MLTIRPIVFVAYFCFFCYANAGASDIQTCETQLNKYRKFILQAILSFEDVCDAYNSRATPLTDAAGFPQQIAFFGHYQPTSQKNDIWQFFKMFMAQFNDLEFTNILRDAVIERCRTKLQMQQEQQKDMKRNAVVIGKKQRFHSWGGKRSGNDMEQEHNDDIAFGF